MCFVYVMFFTNSPSYICRPALQDPKAAGLVALYDEALAQYMKAPGILEKIRKN